MANRRFRVRFLESEAAIERARAIADAITDCQERIRQLVETPKAEHILDESLASACHGEEVTKHLELALFYAWRALALRAGQG